MSLPLIPGDRVSVIRDGATYIEHVWECPCGSYQLHLTAQGEHALPLAERNDAVNDAVWTHEAECEVLQHASMTVGGVRPEGVSLFNLDADSVSPNDDTD